MCSQWAALATFAVAILATVVKPLAPPTTGWLINDGDGQVLFIWPLTATQCEPFYIFYDLTAGNKLGFYDPTTPARFLFYFDVPNGTGYVEWICNVPAGFGFLSVQNYVVEAGSSSDCLGDITTTYSHLTYNTAAFASYTRNPPPLTARITPVTSYVSFPVC